MVRTTDKEEEDWVERRGGVRGGVESEEGRSQRMGGVRGEMESEEEDCEERRIGVVKSE